MGKEKNTKESKNTIDTKKMSLDEYIASRTTPQYKKCKCGGKMSMTSQHNECYKCRSVPCLIENCINRIKRDSQFDICYECNIRMKKRINESDSESD